LKLCCRQNSSERPAQLDTSKNADLKRRFFAIINEVTRRVTRRAACTVDAGFSLS